MLLQFALALMLIVSADGRVFDPEPVPNWPNISDVAALNSSNFATFCYCNLMEEAFKVFPFGRKFLIIDEELMQHIRDSTTNFECRKKKAAIIVMFFDSNNSSNNNYARLFKEVSEAMIDLKKMVGFGIVNCAETTNRELCSTYLFKEVPVLAYFNRNAISANSSMVLAPTTAHELIYFLMDQLSADLVQGMYIDWPNFVMIQRETTYYEFWKSQGRQIYYALLIFIDKERDFSAMSLLVRNYKQSPYMTVRIAHVKSELGRIFRIFGPLCVLIRLNTQEELGVGFYRMESKAPVFKNAEVEFSSLLKDSDFQLYDRYTKFMYNVAGGAHPFTNTPMTATMRMIVPSDYGQSLSRIEGNKHDGIVIRIRDGVEVKKVPVKKLDNENESKPPAS